jgi:hypothetical protein
MYNFGFRECLRFSNVSEDIVVAILRVSVAPYWISPRSTTAELIIGSFESPQKTLTLKMTTEVFVETESFERSRKTKPYIEGRKFSRSSAMSRLEVMVSLLRCVT